MAATKSHKRTINVSLSANLLDEAKELGVNVSQACEKGLAVELKKAREAKWLAENLEAIESSNTWVETYGLPLARYRQF
jgi:antitoxin CcdA